MNIAEQMQADIRFNQIVGEERDSKLNEIGILCEAEIPQKSGIL